ncbi:hypothetical protein T265_14605 [Opisthorchis viverrini]|uniref:Uncharacterized protein n=1 Tax=Opisthorchis viverrini TaxID=6198 RepID=A0A074ZJR7_OPIVI|nr:hypothetical protein T265_14605 [Opisthorchis viverrini]KER23600.1 hypothetical protein T265_14605 [Opisthorchis viverrini]
MFCMKSCRLVALCLVLVGIPVLVTSLRLRNFEDPWGAEIYPAVPEAYRDIGNRFVFHGKTVQGKLEPADKRSLLDPIMF